MDNYFKSKEFKEVLAKYEDLREDQSALLSTGDYTDIAQYYHLKGDDGEALKAIRTALDVYPGSVGPASFLSRYYLLEEQDFKKAKEVAETITDQHDPDYYLLEAEMMLCMNDAAEADDYLEGVYKLFYDDEYYDDMPLDVAMLFTDYEELDYATKWLNRSDDTDSPDYIETKAKILLGTGKEEEGKKLINDLINDDPYSNEYWDLLAAAQAQEGDMSGAITSSDYALAIDTNDRDAVLARGNALMALENYGEAEKMFHKYIELDPGHDTGYTMLGLAFMAQDRAQEALAYYQKALKVNEESPTGRWQSRAEILFQISTLENYLEHFSEVHKYLDRLADVFKDHLSGNMDELGRRLAEVDTAQGHVYLEEEKIDQALEWFDQAVTDSDADPKIYSKIAGSAYESGYVQYAYNILHELLYVNGIDDQSGYHYLSLCCKFLGKEDEQKWAEEKLDAQRKSQEK